MKTTQKIKSTIARTIVAGIAGALLLLGTHGSAQTTTGTSAGNPEAIRSFHVNVPKAALTDPGRRVLAIRWPDHETVADQS